MSSLLLLLVLGSLTNLLRDCVKTALVQPGLVVFCHQVLTQKIQ